MSINFEDHGLLTKDEETELAKRIGKGDIEARNELVRSNLRLVVSIAKHYRNKGLDLEDLEEEGVIGLMGAAEKFDIEKGCRFSTYATDWIRQAIGRAIQDKGRIVRVPAYVQEVASKYKKSLSVLESRLGRQPTEDEIADYLGITKTRLSAVRANLRGETSLDLVEDPLLKSLKDQRAPKPEEEVIKRAESDYARGLLYQLDERERKILALRFGLFGSEQMSLKDVGKRCGLTHQRIQQIEAKVLEKLREYARSGEYVCSEKGQRSVFDFIESIEDAGDLNLSLLKRMLLDRHVSPDAYIDVSAEDILGNRELFERNIEGLNKIFNRYEGLFTGSRRGITTPQKTIVAVRLSPLIIFQGQRRRFSQYGGPEEFYRHFEWFYNGMSRGVFAAVDPPLYQALRTAGLLEKLGIPIIQGGSGNPLTETEKAEINSVYGESGGNVSKAAKVLDRSRVTISSCWREAGYDIEDQSISVAEDDQKRAEFEGAFYRHKGNASAASMEGRYRRKTYLRNWEILGLRKPKKRARHGPLEQEDKDRITGCYQESGGSVSAASRYLNNVYSRATITRIWRQSGFEIAGIGSNQFQKP